MLYKRITEQGTISEPEGKPNPAFALPSTVNWMRALALLVDDPPVNFSTAKAFYTGLGVGKRAMSPQVENTILEQLFLSLHHLSALEQMQGGAAPADLARVGVLAWYYGIANASSAMTAAQNGSFQEDHSGTARMWDAEIAARGLAMPPFSWRVSSLVEKTYKPQIAAYRAGSKAVLLSLPATKLDAAGAAAAYLSGSASWYAWYVVEDVRSSQEFKDLGAANFMTKSAQQIRDKRLDTRSVGFLHQASRYRGKANYREALFLAHGKSTGTQLAGFVANQATVLRSFLAMAGAFASRKLGKDIWAEFVADVDAQRAFTTSATSVWS